MVDYGHFPLFLVVFLDLCRMYVDSSQGLVSHVGLCAAAPSARLPALSLPVTTGICKFCSKGPWQALCPGSGVLSREGNS